MDISSNIASILTTWYKRNRRSLPWRYTKDPYAIWISEIMLQQTTVITATPYFENFMQLWPSIKDLATASLDDILLAWQGLGYYHRAKNLYACAQILAKKEGQFPQEEKELRQLPGIGPYTASAIAAIAFQKKTTVIDANVERVICRLFAVKTPLHSSKKYIKALADDIFLQLEDSASLAQGFMDLSATICKKTPLCHMCPLQSLCKGYAQKIAASLPIKKPKDKKPQRYAQFFWVQTPKGEVFIQKRPNTGLLPGLMECISTPWYNNPINSRVLLFEGKADYISSFIHVFSHFTLHVQIYKVIIEKKEELKGLWLHPNNFSAYAFSSLMKKTIHIMTKEHE